MIIYQPCFAYAGLAVEECWLFVYTLHICNLLKNWIAIYDLCKVCVYFMGVCLRNGVLNKTNWIKCNFDDIIPLFQEVFDFYKARIFNWNLALDNRCKRFPLRQQNNQFMLILTIFLNKFVRKTKYLCILYKLFVNNFKISFDYVSEDFDHGFWVKLKYIWPQHNLHFFNSNIILPLNLHLPHILAIMPPFQIKIIKVHFADIISWNTDRRIKWSFYLILSTIRLHILLPIKQSQIILKF